jgi:hypothetical protein
VDGKLSCWFIVSCRWIGGDERKQGDDTRNPWLSTEFVRNGREWTRKRSRKLSQTAREGKGSEERRGASEGAPAAQRGRESERGRSADDEEARHEEVARSFARFSGAEQTKE